MTQINASLMTEIDERECLADADDPDSSFSASRNREKE